VQQNTQALLASMEQLIQRQAELWGKTVAEMDKRSEAVHAAPREQFVGAMQQALELALTAHAQKLSAMEGKSVERTGKMVETMASLAAAVRDTSREQQAALLHVAESVAGQAAVLGRLQEGETNLVHLQAVLHQNLAALANASSFEQAVHSLTAAVHLLTSRAAAQAGASTPPTLQLRKVA
jgi:hypothetical protein